MKNYHWSELNELGRKNQALYLAELMHPSMHVVDIDDWENHRVAFFYLPAELHMEPAPFGMKVSASLKPGQEPPTLDELIQLILEY